MPFTLSVLKKRAVASALTPRRYMSTELRDFLALSYGELEELNLAAKEQRKKRVDPETIREERLKYLTDEKRIKAVTVMFSDRSEEHTSELQSLTNLVC